MVGIRSILLLSGVLWMIALWTWTSPLPVTYFLKYPLLPRRIVSTGVVILFFLQLFRFISFTASWLTTPIASFTGTIIFLGGIVLASWAKFVMKSAWGEPGQHDITRQKALVTGGPFAFSRNPIYIGLLMIFFGFELSVGSWILFVFIALTALVHKAIIKEESLLAKHFGKPYDLYRKRVPRYV